MKVVIPDDPSVRPFNYEQGRLGALEVEGAPWEANDAAVERKAAACVEAVTRDLTEPDTHAWFIESGQREPRVASAGWERPR